MPDICEKTALQPVESIVDQPLVKLCQLAAALKRLFLPHQMHKHHPVSSTFYVHEVFKCNLVYLQFVHDFIKGFIQLLHYP